jgi:competence protein ComEA
MKRQLVSAVLILLMVATASAVAETGGTKGVVNINTASSEELQLLPRVGPALAERIIDFRESNGPFKRVEEIVAVKGIGERSLEQLRPHLVVKGETTLKEKVSLPRTSSDGEKK